MHRLAGKLMKRAHFILAFCAIAGTVDLVGADECNGHCSACTQCCVRDDRGLLDWVDSFAGRIQQGVQRGTSNFGKVAGSISLRNSHSNCDIASQGCGCELTSGCSSCGKSDSSAILETHDAPPRVPSHGDLKWTPAQPQPRPSTQNGDSVLPSLDIPSPRAVPDSQVNPFSDEPQASNRVRGQTIQYRQPASTLKQPRPRPSKYGQQYSSEAANSSGPFEKQPGQFVRTASSEDMSIPDAFKMAYRVRLADATDNSGPEHTAKRHSELRPVPDENTSSRLSNQAESSSEISERDEAVELPAYPNPLRR
jgi:hypothetical protein